MQNSSNDVRGRTPSRTVKSVLQVHCRRPPPTRGAATDPEPQGEGAGSHFQAFQAIPMHQSSRSPPSWERLLRGNDLSQGKHRVPYQGHFRHIPGHRPEDQGSLRLGSVVRREGGIPGSSGGLWFGGDVCSLPPSGQGLPGQSRGPQPAGDRSPTLSAPGKPGTRICRSCSRGSTGAVGRARSPLRGGGSPPWQPALAVGAGRPDEL